MILTRKITNPEPAIWAHFPRAGEQKKAPNIVQNEDMGQDHCCCWKMLNRYDEDHRTTWEVNNSFPLCSVGKLINFPLQEAAVKGNQLVLL